MLLNKQFAYVLTISYLIKISVDLSSVCRNYYIGDYSLILQGV